MSVVRELVRESPLQVPTGSAAVFRGIRKAIVEGVYACNERLPSERSLAASFGCARGTVRAALARLEKAHYVRRKTSSGAYVIYNNRFQRRDIAEETSPIELIDARLALEPYMVKLAIRNANNRDLELLEDAVEQLMSAGDDPERFSIADEAFHLALSQCTRNPLLIWFYERVNDIRSHNQWNARKAKVLTGERIAIYNRQHRALVEAIRQRDHKAASDIIQEHLIRARNDLLGSS